MPKGGVLPAWVGAAIQQFQSRDWQKPFTSIDQPLSCVPQTSQAAVKRSRRWSVQLLAALLPHPRHLPSSHRALLSLTPAHKSPPAPLAFLFSGSTGIFNFWHDENLPHLQTCEPCSQCGFYKDLSTFPLSHPWPWLLHQFHVAKTSRGGLHLVWDIPKNFRYSRPICQLNWLLMIG